jgi:hypothetical protein
MDTTRMNPVLRRFIKGLVAAAIAAATPGVVAWARGEAVDWRQAIFVPVITATLLAIEKWLKER